MTSIPYVLKSNYLSLILDGKATQITPEHGQFKAIAAALKAKNFDEVRQLLVMPTTLAKLTFGRVQVNGDEEVLYNGRKLHGVLVERIIQLIQDGGNPFHMLRFIDNIHQNPSKLSIDELFLFLENCNLPITDDGCFLAYKVVTADYLDCYTRTISNAVGNIVSMPRKNVDANRNHHCSKGLHFCSAGYIASYSGAKVVMIKINPRDVVSIPADYGNTKGRTWRYEVVADLGDWSALQRGSAAHEKLGVLKLNQERRDILKAVLHHPETKRRIRNGEIATTTIQKQTYGRLKAMLEKLPGQGKVAAAVPSCGVAGALYRNPIREARQAAGVTVRAVADYLGMNYKAVWAAEKSTQLPPDGTIQRYMNAITALSSHKHVSYSGNVKGQQA